MGLPVAVLVMTENGGGGGMRNGTTGTGLGEGILYQGRYCGAVRASVCPVMKLSPGCEWAPLPSP